MGLRRLEELYARASAHPDDQAFLKQVLSDLAIRVVASEGDLSQIPRTGPALVVANHPFGAIEGTVAASLLKSVRGDVKIMANYHLSRIPELRDLFFLVDPYAREGSARENMGPLRQCRAVAEGGRVAGGVPSGRRGALGLEQRAREGIGMEPDGGEDRPSCRLIPCSRIISAH